MAALVAGQPVDRIRSELFNAGDEWQRELASPAVACFAEALDRAFERLPDLLEASTQPTLVIADLVSETRDLSIETGFSAALALAEHAFAKVLLQPVYEAETLIGPGSAIADLFRAQDPDPNVLIAKYAGEILGLFARHAIDREAGRLASSKEGDRTRQEQIKESLVEQARRIGVSSATQALVETSLIREAWFRAIAGAFEVGRALGEAQP